MTQANMTTVKMLTTVEDSNLFKVEEGKEKSTSTIGWREDKSGDEVIAIRCVEKLYQDQVLKLPARQASSLIKMKYAEEVS